MLMRKSLFRSLRMACVLCFVLLCVNVFRFRFDVSAHPPANDESNPHIVSMANLKLLAARSAEMGPPPHVETRTWNVHTAIAHPVRRHIPGRRRGLSPSQVNPEVVRRVGDGDASPETVGPTTKPHVIITGRPGSSFHTFAPPAQQGNTISTWLAAQSLVITGGQYWQRRENFGSWLLTGRFVGEASFQAGIASCYTDDAWDSTLNMCGPSVDTTNTLSRISCRRNEHLDSTVCTAQNIVLDNTQVQVSHGGEEITDVMGRSELDELPEYRARALKAACTAWLPNSAVGMNEGNYVVSLLGRISYNDNVAAECAE